MHANVLRVTSGNDELVYETEFSVPYPRGYNPAFGYWLPPNDGEESVQIN